MLDHVKKHFDIREIFEPRLFKILKQRQYSKQTFKADLVSGLMVGIVAIPLGIAFSTSAGFSPDKGLITCIIAAIVVSLFGGSNFQIAGPTGAFIVVIGDILSQFPQYGISALVISTILAGVMLILMGILKLGNIMKFIPYPITVGLTGGIAVTIFSSQIKDFFGLQCAVPSDFIEKWTSYIQNFYTFDWYTTLISVGTILVIILFPRITKKIPVYLVAIIIISGITALLKFYLGLETATIGSKFPELTGAAPSLPAPQTPGINMVAIKTFIQPAFTIAMLCAIQTTLSAMVADGATGKKHHANTELIGQGLANIVIPLFGGIPSAGAIARTMANVNNGGKTPVAGLVHAVFLILVLIFLMPLAVYIPMACLAGIVVMVAYNMSEWRSFKALLSNPRSDVIVLIVTTCLTIVIGLTIAVELGLLMALLLFLKRVTDTSGISVLTEDIKNSEDEENSDSEVLNIPHTIEVYEINGPFFFGIANKFDEVDDNKKKTLVRIIRMRKVPFIDSTGLHNLRNLWKRCKKEKIQLVLSGVTPEVKATLTKAGFTEELGEEYVCNHISIAVEKAKEIVSKFDTLQKK